MKRVNKTRANLELVWKQLDEASGSLYNALDNIGSMVNVDDLQNEADRVDPTQIDSLKNLIEELLNEKK